MNDGIYFSLSKYLLTSYYNTFFSLKYKQVYIHVYFIFIRTLWFLDRLDYNNDVPSDYINFD